MAVSRMRNTSGHNYRNSSFIVDLAMGQIPRYTEPISSFQIIVDEPCIMQEMTLRRFWFLLDDRCPFGICRQLRPTESSMLRPRVCHMGRAIGSVVALTTNDSSLRNWASSTAVGGSRSEISPGRARRTCERDNNGIYSPLQWLARADLKPRCHANDVVDNHRRRRTTVQRRYCWCSHQPLNESSLPALFVTSLLTTTKTTICVNEKSKQIVKLQLISSNCSKTLQIRLRF